MSKPPTDIEEKREVVGRVVWVAQRNPDVLAAYR